MSTKVVASFVDNQTVQLRFELGEVVDAVQTTDIPPGLTPDPDTGYVWQDGAYIGRVAGPNGAYFMPFDTLQTSKIADLFNFGDTNGISAAPVDTASDWTVLVNGAPIGIDTLSRKSNILDSAEVDWFKFEFATVENVFIKLDAPIAQGDAVTISFDDADFTDITTTFDPAQTVSEAVHVNLAGFDPDDQSKVAFLSSWNGWEVDGALENGGQQTPQTYAAGTSFSVINAETSEVVYSGEIALAQAIADPTGFSLNYQGSDLYRMDFSDFSEAGSYFVAVDGVGTSQTFEIGETHWDDLFQTSFSGFYHQRSGIALEAEFTDWTRPASLTPDNVTVLETTVQIQETNEGYDSNAPTPFSQFPDNTTGAVVTDAWGGWHDAGDWDRRTQHLEASRKLIELVELKPEFAEATDGSIPESGDGIPDLLDEAIWGMDVFRRMQTEDGGIRGGIESAESPLYGDGSWGESLPVYAYAPDVWSSWEFAASAAKLANTLKNYDATAADGWLASAQDAMAWAEARVPTGDDYDATLNASRNLAAAELFNATGDEQWNTLYKATSSYVEGAEGVSFRDQQYEAAFVYARTNQPTADPTLQANGVAALELNADVIMNAGTTGGFGYQSNAYAPYGWGNTAQQPDSSADVFLRLHALTGDESWLKIVQADVQYALGANPLNMSYMTGIDGVRSPLEILNLDADTLGKGPPPSITLYGDYNINDNGYNFYHEIMQDAVWPNYYQVPVSESFNAFSFFVPSTEYTVQQGMTDMTFVTGYLAAENMGVAPTPLDDDTPDKPSDDGPKGSISSMDKQAMLKRFEDEIDAFKFAYASRTSAAQSATLNGTRQDLVDLAHTDTIEFAFDTQSQHSNGRDLDADSSLILSIIDSTIARPARTASTQETYDWSQKTRTYDEAGNLIPQVSLPEDASVENHATAL